MCRNFFNVKLNVRMFRCQLPAEDTCKVFLYPLYHLWFLCLLFLPFRPKKINKVLDLVYVRFTFWFLRAKSVYCHHQRSREDKRVTPLSSLTAIDYFTQQGLVCSKQDKANSGLASIFNSLLLTTWIPVKKLFSLNNLPDFGCFQTVN